MGFASIGSPDCCCTSGPPPTCRVTITVSACTFVPTDWVIKTRPGGVTVATGRNYTITGGVPSPTGFPMVATLPSGDYTITSVFTGTGLGADGCDDPTFDSPHSQDFTLNCPTPLGIVLSTTYTSFSRIFSFQPSFTPDPTCPTVANCTTLFDDLTIVATTPGSVNVARHGDINFGPAPILISGLAPSADLTIYFRVHNVYTSLPGHPPCPIIGEICQTYCGSVTVNVDPCSETACNYPLTIHVPMHICVYGVDP